jgi:hypothetical protein
MRGTLLGVALAMVAGGCTLDFGGDDEPPCLDSPAAGDERDELGAPVPELLNPETLLCESFGGGGCNPACGPCDQPPAEPTPTWAYCGTCQGIDEVTCLEASGCRAVYDYACYTGDGPCTALQPYIGCYGTDQTGPIQGSCAGLDAFSCSQHDDCLALHEPQCSGDPNDCWAQFIECRDETTCWGEVTCDGLPPACPPESTPEIRNGCYTGDCIPLDECEPVCDTTDCG